MILFLDLEAIVYAVIGLALAVLAVLRILRGPRGLDGQAMLAGACGFLMCGRFVSASRPLEWVWVDQFWAFGFALIMAGLFYSAWRSTQKAA